MKKEDIIKDIISKNVLISTDKNFLQLFGSIDISMYGAKAWAVTLQEIGLKKGSSYLFDSGYIMGRDAALELKETVNKRKVFLPKKFFLLENIIEIMGFGMLKVEKYTPKKRIRIRLLHNIVVKYGQELYGRKSLINNFYAGVYSGFIELFLDFRKCKLIEKPIKDTKKEFIFEYNAK